MPGCTRCGDSRGRNLDNPPPGGSTSNHKCSHVHAHTPVGPDVPLDNHFLLVMLTGRRRWELHLRDACAMGIVLNNSLGANRGNDRNMLSVRAHARSRTRTGG